MLWHLAKHQHLALVRLAGLVALEAVLITALLVAHLAVPAQLLQALGFDAVRNLRTHKSAVQFQGPCADAGDLVRKLCPRVRFWARRSLPSPPLSPWSHTMRMFAASHRLHQHFCKSIARGDVTQQLPHSEQQYITAKKVS